MLSSQAQLEYTGSGARYNIPDRPYKCDQCQKAFTQLGGMMQHQVKIQRCKMQTNIFQVSVHGIVNRRLALS